MPWNLCWLSLHLHCVCAIENAFASLCCFAGKVAMRPKDLILQAVKHFYCCAVYPQILLLLKFLFFSSFEDSIALLKYSMPCEILPF